MDYDACVIAEVYDKARALLPATARLWQELIADYADPGAAPPDPRSRLRHGSLLRVAGAAVRRPGHRDRPVRKDAAAGPPQAEPR